tara:strand:+ start:604 stop:828 length:225 start_codon:yes stop_codon:yes gene_type:complete
LTLNLLSLFPYVKELEKQTKDSKIIIDFLDFTIVEMKKEMVEREISQKRYLAKIDQLEKMDKLEKLNEEMFRKY